MKHWFSMVILKRFPVEKLRIAIMCNQCLSFLQVERTGGMETSFISHWFRYECTDLEEIFLGEANYHSSLGLKELQGILKSVLDTLCYSSIVKVNLEIWALFTNSMTIYSSGVQSVRLGGFENRYQKLSPRLIEPSSTRAFHENHTTRSDTWMIHCHSRWYAEEYKYYPESQTSKSAGGW